MIIHFNADEIFRMARQIELNGSRFYAKAAQIVKDEKAKSLLKQFSYWEAEHENTFAKMQKEFRNKEKEKRISQDPDDVAGAYLRAIAGGYIFKLDQKPWDLLTGDQSLKQILKIAIETEKNAVLFYLGLQARMTGDVEKNQVAKIITEEMSHITILAELLKANQGN